MDNRGAWIFAITRDHRSDEEMIGMPVTSGSGIHTHQPPPPPPGEQNPVVYWPDPSPLDAWWSEVMAGGEAGQ